tara:strand:- start:25 stop:492 length:468 start_codon:yes stop_codon:yes gene_type:complete
MKIIYGKGQCSLSSMQDVKSIVIKYRGSVSVTHNHLHFGAFLDGDRVLFNNYGARSLLVHGNNQIHIGVMDGGEIKEELFNYIGEFRIISAKVNDKNVPIEVFGVDYWNMIDSDWDYAGKPEIYKGTYRHGRSPKKKASKRLNNKKVNKLSSRRY